MGWVENLCYHRGFGLVHKLMGWVGFGEEKWTHVHLWVHGSVDFNGLQQLQQFHP